MDLKTRIMESMKAAMKDRDKVRVAAYSFNPGRHPEGRD